jgi:hypothetical protein
MPSFAVIQAALEYCMSEQPPRDFVLSNDASQLATVFADMAYHRQTERPVENLTDKQRLAFLRWSDSSASK